MCGCLLSTPCWGAGLHLRRGLSGNQTGNSLLRRPTLNPLSHTSQGTILASDQGTCLGCGPGPWLGMRKGQPADRCFSYTSVFLSHINVSLPLSSSLFLE